MIPIIIVSVAAVLFFLVLVITSIILLVNKIRKKQKVKRDLVIVIAISLIFFSLIGLDAYFISNSIYENRDKIKDAAAEASGRGLVITYDAIKKTWDDRSVVKLKNIDITVLKSSEVIKGDIKTYEIEIVFNNKNTNAESMPISEMVSINYLALCDKDDIVYGIDNFKSETPLLPTGKSKATLFINVAKDVKLDYVRLVDNKIALKN